MATSYYLTYKQAYGLYAGATSGGGGEPEPEPEPGAGGENGALTTTLTGASTGTAGTAQQLNATATNPAVNGSIDRVDLLLMANATTLTDYLLLDTKYGPSPYTFLWTPINEGQAILRVRAIDDENKRDFSPPLTIQVASMHVLPYLVSPTLDISSITRDKVADDLVVYNADQSVLNTGRALFSLRGNSTATKPKKPLSTSLVAADNVSSRKVSLFGMYVDDGYNELAEYDDQTLVKNATFLRLAKALGLIAPRFQPMERFDSKGYQGYYTLTEKIKGAILPGYTKLTKVDADQVLPNLSGGYLIETVMPAFDADIASKNTFSTKLLEDTKSGPNYDGLERLYSLELPKPEDVTPAQNAYIRQHMAEVDASLDLPWNHPDGPQKYLHAESWIAHAIFEEFVKNCDTAALSEYLYKPREGKIRRVVWDQDNAAPYDGVVAPADPKGQWAALTPRLRRLYKDLDFGRAVYDTYLQKRSLIEEAITYATDRTSLYANQGVASKQIARWGIRIPNGSQSRTRDFSVYGTNVTLFLQWMRDRLSALDNMLAGFASPVASAPALVLCSESSTAKRLQEGPGWVTYRDMPDFYIGGEVHYVNAPEGTDATRVTYFGRNISQFCFYARGENTDSKGPVRVFVKEPGKPEVEMLPQPTQRQPLPPDGRTFRYYTSPVFNPPIEASVRLQYVPGQSAYMEDNAWEITDRPGIWLV